MNTAERLERFEQAPGFDFKLPAVRNKMQAEMLIELRIPEEKWADWVLDKTFQIRKFTESDPAFLECVARHDWEGAREALIEAGNYRSAEETQKWKI